MIFWGVIMNIEIGFPQPFHLESIIYTSESFPDINLQWNDE